MKAPALPLWTPRSPVLIVEVAESSLRLDRLRKGALYARAGIAELP